MIHMDEYIKKIPANYALHNQVLPLRSENGVLIAALAQPENVELTHELEFIFNQKIKFEKWDEKVLIECIKNTYRLTNADIGGENGFRQYEHLEKSSNNPSLNNASLNDDHSIITLVNKFISEAIQMTASDIHVGKL